MAVICNICYGIVPDVMLGSGDRNDCKNHVKRKYDLPKRD